MANKVPVYFNTAAYERTYRHGPRGYGSWAFDIYATGERRPINGNEPVWAPSMTYGKAKTWVSAHARALVPAGYAGDIEIVVLT